MNAADFAWIVRERLEAVAQTARDARCSTDADARDASAYARGLEEAREVVLEVLRGGTEAAAHAAAADAALKPSRPVLPVSNEPRTGAPPAAATVRCGVRDALGVACERERGHDLHTAPGREWLSRPLPRPERER